MKYVKGFEDLYSVTEDGKIYSHRSERFLELSQKKNGYVYVEFNVNGRVSYHRVHRLVAEAYIPNIENKPFVNHIDGVKNNNHYRNLEWVTGTENNLHAIESGLVDLHDLWEVRRDGELLGTYRGYREIIEEFGISKNTIYNSIKLKRPTRNGLTIERSTTIPQGSTLK